MKSETNLQRFIDAQKAVYAIALSEIKHGKKRSHWMWYIFPQIAGLGFSETSKFYSFKNLHEAEAYLQHPVLGPRLIEISNALFDLKSDDAVSVFGTPDDQKLKSCMTLFSILPGTNPVFQAVLDKFFHGLKDAKTLEILNEWKRRI
ncbi:MAG: DUF1810 domain-containing protein [Ginsengibacter sp.]